MEKQLTTGILEEFRIEFLECWQRLPNKAFFFILLAAWVALFHFLGNATLGYIRTPSLLHWMYNSYFANATSDDSHGFFIPFVVLGLFWWKRKELIALPLKAWWPGLLLLAPAVLLHLAGYAVQQPRISIIALFIGLYGLMALAWGPAWLRSSFFPFFLFAFSVPLGSLAESITFPLRLLVCRLVEFICHFILAIDIIRDGTALIDPTGRYQYEVAAACSGMRSLIATLALALIYAWLSFPQWWKRAVLIASAFPLAIMGMAIVIAAEIGGKKAGDFVHEGGPFGIISLLPYVPAFAGLLMLGHWLRPREAAPILPLETKTA